MLKILETKLDLHFPKGQFHLHGFPEPHRLYRNENGGGIAAFIRQGIPPNLYNQK